ncbi:peptidase M14 [Neobacillus piezotolerans]|uniref:Peptidase M14 n=1 Tax=Neobacillus piezotolerans TaxID=2259171 RepID=A0A3D8GLR6_9BACI|nr:M14 family metallocarboxypeptidase [Neobacillus piezotolerans]RDU35373.1 peptidase M14 [Neobacillus piezotolerans]
MIIGRLPGGSLADYARLFRLQPELIQKSNEPGLCVGEVGEKVCIPGYSGKPYRLKEGETVDSVASNCHFDSKAIKLMNQGVQGHPGSSILLPYRVESPVVIGRTEYSPAILARDLEALTETYPFAKVSPIGYSVLGKPIWELKIGSGERKIHFNASFHANEWITSGILMELVNMYLLALCENQSVFGKEALSIFESTELSVVPMVNPDGVDLVLNGPPAGFGEAVTGMNGGRTDFSGWKANIRGVDLNNQFPANWEVEKERKEPQSPAPRDFPGTAPLSEPEALAMARLTEKSGFDAVIAFHTQGEEFYWGYGGREPAVSSYIAAEFSRLSGYRAVRTIDSHAGFKDWFIQEYRRPGFTIELGKGINPLPLSCFNKIYRDVSGIFQFAIGGCC